MLVRLSYTHKRVSNVAYLLLVGPVEDTDQKPAPHLIFRWWVLLRKLDPHLTISTAHSAEHMCSSLHGRE